MQSSLQTELNWLRSSVPAARGGQTRLANLGRTFSYQDRVTGGDYQNAGGNFNPMEYPLALGTGGSCLETFYEYGRACLQQAVGRTC
jgi:hypothetical protein